MTSSDTRSTSRGQLYKSLKNQWLVVDVGGAGPPKVRYRVSCSPSMCDSHSFHRPQRVAQPRPDPIIKRYPMSHSYQQYRHIDMYVYRHQHRRRYIDISSMLYTMNKNYLTMWSILPMIMAGPSKYRYIDCNYVRIR